MKLAKRIWGVSDFSRYWAAQSVSLFGTEISAVALPLMAAVLLKAGVGGVSLVTTASFLPSLLWSVPVGHWLHHRQIGRVIFISDLARAALLAAVPIAYLAGFLSIGLLAVDAFLVGSFGVAFAIATFAYIPELVEEDDLGRANQAMQGSATVAQVGGPGLGGILVGALGAPLAIAADAASYLVGALGVPPGRRAAPTVEARPPGHFLDGVRRLLGNVYLRALTVHASIYNAGFQVLLVNLLIWAVDDRGVSPGLYGLVLSAQGVGALIGTMWALRSAERRGYGGAFALALTLSCGAPLLMATLPFSGLALAAPLAAIQFVAGIGLGAANVLSTTLRQTVIPAEELAPTIGAYRFLMFGSIPIGSALGGVLGAALGGRAGVAIGTATLAVSALPMFARPIRSLRSPRDARAPAEVSVGGLG